jgi:hypothetical protein
MTEQIQEQLKDVFTDRPVGEEFDFLLRFTKDTNTVELFMDDNVRDTIEGLLKLHGKLVVKVNWFADRLTIIAPKQ